MDGGQHLYRGGAHAGILVFQRLLDRRQPALHELGARILDGFESAGAYFRRAVSEQERCYQVAFLESLEKLDRAQHPLSIRTSELLHEGLHRRQIACLGREPLGLERQRLDATAKRGHVLSLG